MLDIFDDNAHSMEDYWVNQVKYWGWPDEDSFLGLNLSYWGKSFDE